MVELEIEIEIEIRGKEEKKGVKKKHREKGLEILFALGV